MKHFVKYPFALALLALGSFTPNSQAARYIWFDEPMFLDHGWIDDLVNFQHHAMDVFRHHAHEYGPSKEDREAIKNARETLAKIKYTITDDEHKVKVQLSGFENLDKKDIHILKKENHWLGTVTTKDGTVEFVIASNGLQISRRVELKKESKEQDKDQKDKRDYVSYTTALATEAEYFKQHVNIATLKAEPVKDNTLTLTIDKQKEEILPIP